MIKSISLLTRKDAMTHEQFISTGSRCAPRRWRPLHRPHQELHGRGVRRRPSV